jgi:hypothetical protein
MRFYSEEECEKWLTSRKREKPNQSDAPHSETFKYPEEPYRFYSLARMIASSSCRDPILLWVSEWGVWPTSENWHVYYKLRHSYADHRLLHEAPGHFFMGYEMEDCASFLQIAMLNGWGGHVLTQANYVNAFFSHDEYIRFFANDAAQLDEIRKFFEH